jgi:hypothetical protein
VGALLYRAHPGVSLDIPFLKRRTRLTFARCGIVDRLSTGDYRAHHGWRGLERAIALGPEATVEEVIKSGLRGRGGAGFPTGSEHFIFGLAYAQLIGRFSSERLELHESDQC